MWQSAKKIFVWPLSILFLLNLAVCLNYFHLPPRLLHLKEHFICQSLDFCLFVLIFSVCLTGWITWCATARRVVSDENDPSRSSAGRPSEDVFSPFPPFFPYFIKGKYHYFSDAQQRFLQHSLYFIMWEIIHEKFFLIRIPASRNLLRQQHHSISPPPPPPKSKNSSRSRSNESAFKSVGKSIIMLWARFSRS